MTPAGKSELPEATADFEVQSPMLIHWSDRPGQPHVNIACLNRELYVWVSTPDLPDSVYEADGNKELGDPTKVRYTPIQDKVTCEGCLRVINRFGEALKAMAKLADATPILASSTGEELEAWEVGSGEVALVDKGTGATRVLMPREFYDHVRSEKESG